MSPMPGNVVRSQRASLFYYGDGSSHDSWTLKVLLGVPAIGAVAPFCRDSLSLAVYPVWGSVPSRRSGPCADNNLATFPRHEQP